MQAKKPSASQQQVAKDSSIERVRQKERRGVCDKLAYSVKEAAEAIGVSAWYIRDEMAHGKLAFSCPRGRQLIPCWELVRYLEANMSPTMQVTDETASAAARAAALLLSTQRKQMMA